MTYTARKPNIAYPSSELGSRIIGWGVDLNPADRPAVPKESYDPGATGAHWDFPERQIERYPREKSTEHRFVTPVFGTACPPKGLSGMIRRYAYTKSEAKTSHWTLLVLADRIDVIESRITGLLRGRPDNLFSEMGLRSELRFHGIRSRLGQHRADLKHLPIDIMMFTATTVVTGIGLYALAKAGSRVVRRKKKVSGLAAVGRALAKVL